MNNPPSLHRFVRLQKHSSRTSHFACFNCRKQSRKPVDELIQRNPAWPVGRRVSYDGGLVSYPCPQCGQTMIHMGKNFRPPPQADVESWAVAQRLAAEGYRHDYTSGLIYPTKLKDVSAFLETHRQLSEGEKLLEKWEKL